jgi:hypothetical protein
MRLSDDGCSDSYSRLGYAHRPLFVPKNSGAAALRSARAQMGCCEGNALELAGGGSELLLSITDQQSPCR